MGTGRQLTQKGAQIATPAVAGCKPAEKMVQLRPTTAFNTESGAGLTA